METHQLSLCGQTLQRFFLKYGGVILQIGEYVRIQDHETAVDEAGILLILLAEGTYRVVVADVQNSLHLCDVHRRHGGRLSMLLMELHEGIQIHGAHAVAVRHHKWLIADIRLNPLDSSACHRV